MNHRVLFAAMVMGMAALGPAGSAVADQTKPNILFIMVDDLGKEWVSCVRHTYQESPTFGIASNAVSARSVPPLHIR